jgi:hypothetical protein
VPDRLPFLHSDTPQDAEACRFDASALKSRDRRRRYAGRMGKAGLSPAAPKPECPDDGTEPGVMHAAEFADERLSAAHPSLICHETQPV